MKANINKIAFATVLSILGVFSMPSNAFCYDSYDRSEAIIIKDKTVNSASKVWNVKFSSDVNINDLLGSINVRDLTKGTLAEIKVIQGESKNSLKINPPSQGYETGHNYQIMINKDNQSKGKKKLKKTVVMNFTVTENNTGSNNSNNTNNGSSSSNSGNNNANTTYTADAKVVSSPLVPYFKNITISSTNISNAKKFKIEGNDTVFSIGDTISTIVTGSTAAVYFYGADGLTLVGKSVLDVSKSNDNIRLKITK